MAGLLPCCVHKHAAAADPLGSDARVAPSEAGGRRPGWEDWSLWWWSSSSLPTPLPMPFVLSLYVFCCHVQVFFSVYGWLESSRSMTFKAKVDCNVFENVGVYWHAVNGFGFVSFFFFFFQCWASQKKKKKKERKCTPNQANIIVHNNFTCLSFFQKVSLICLGALIDFILEDQRNCLVHQPLHYLFIWATPPFVHNLNFYQLLSRVLCWAIFVFSAVFLLPPVVLVKNLCKYSLCKIKWGLLLKRKVIH